MAQIKVYGVQSALSVPGRKSAISNVIHAAVVECLQLPPEKRFHRFFALDREDFLFPDDRSDQYLIIEISLFEGRALETKKRLIYSLFAGLSAVGIAENDVEITLSETPRHNWGIRGRAGDELGLSYRVEV